MAAGITTAFWGMTINNYDETDLAMVQNGYPDYLREIVYTLEKGEEGTPHIQAWIKLQRQQRLSFVKKLFPRGHFKPLSSDVYIANTKKYAQKLDDTAVTAAVHKFNDPVHTLESVIRKMVIKIIDDEDLEGVTELDECKTYIEKLMVKEDYRYAKIFVSATYRQMWKQFGHEMYENIFHAHTHTHTDEKFSQEVDIPTTDGREGLLREESHEEEGDDASHGTSSSDQDTVEDDHSEADEGYDESSGSGSDAEDD